MYPFFLKKMQTYHVKCYHKSQPYFFVFFGFIPLFTLFTAQTHSLTKTNSSLFHELVAQSNT